MFLKPKHLKDISKMKIKNEVFPIPKHLKDILIPVGDENGENLINGTIRCSCTCERFRVKIFADTTEGYPQVCEYKDGYALVINAVCMNCGKEHMIFDDCKHGWNGFICHDGVSVPDNELKPWHCVKCSNDVFNMKICIMSQGKQDFIDESGIADGETEFSEDDWTEAFEWITIGLDCCGCGHSDKQWIDYETM